MQLTLFVPGMLEYVIFLVMRRLMPEPPVPFGIDLCIFTLMILLTSLLSRVHGVTVFGVICAAYCVVFELGLVERLRKAVNAIIQPSRAMRCVSVWRNTCPAS